MGGSRATRDTCEESQVTVNFTSAMIPSRAHPIIFDHHRDRGHSVSDVDVKAIEFYVNLLPPRYHSIGS